MPSLRTSASVSGCPPRALSSASLGSHPFRYTSTSTYKEMSSRYHALWPPVLRIRRFPIDGRHSPSPSRCVGSSSYDKVNRFCKLSLCPTFRGGYNGRIAMPLQFRVHRVLQLLPRVLPIPVPEALIQNPIAYICVLISGQNLNSQRLLQQIQQLFEIIQISSRCCINEIWK